MHVWLNSKFILLHNGVGQRKTMHNGVGQRKTMHNGVGQRKTAEPAMCDTAYRP
jgi:hypothetical protein